MKHDVTIGIDAFPLTNNITGIGRYVVEICRVLDILIPEAHFFLYSPTPLRIEHPSKRWTTRVDSKGWKRSMSSYGWLKLRTAAMCHEDKIQIFWSTRTILPRISSQFKTLATVYDLNYNMFPRSMPLVTRCAHRLWFARDLRRADSIVGISKGTNKRLQKTLGITVDAVVYPGVTSLFRPQAPEIVQSTLDNHGITRPYFLAVGTLEPRKNFPTLIKAFTRLRQTGKANGYELVIAGHPGWQDVLLKKQIKDGGSTGIRWLGFVSDKDLASLYTGAEAFIFPSLYEGFGIPVLEARACGTKVVGTDIPEIREAGGANGIYCHPTIEGIATGINKVIIASPVKQNSPDRLFTWNKAGEIMAKTIRQLVEVGP